MKTHPPRFIALMVSLAAVLVMSAGCKSTQKMINTGNYDLAIARCVNKLQKNKTKEKYILLLQVAYDKANKRDLDRIDFLKKEGAAGNSVEVYKLYDRIGSRQAKIRPLMPLYVEGRIVDFTFLDIDHERIVWKKEAAHYLYQNSLDLLAKKDKYLAREAYDQLLELSHISPHYKDVDQQIQRAYNVGVNLVLFNVVNRSPNIIPMEFVFELYGLEFQRLEEKWFKIITTPDRNSGDEFDYRIDMIIDLVNVGPERTVEKVHTEKKTVEDGWTYVYDASGNVMKDSLGNDIKQTKYKEISAEVTEITQTKAATFNGKIEIYDAATERMERSIPVHVKFIFDHHAAVVKGNMDALSKETAEKLQWKPVPFPTDFQMIMDGSREIRPVIRNFIMRNQELLAS